MADTEYISKEAALACFSDWIDRYGHEHTAEEMIEYQRIEDLPVADVVEVVRCKDCVYYNTTGCAVGFGWCEEPTVSNGVDDNYYCAGGIRREVDADGES